MRTLICALLLLALTHAHIYSTTPKTTYDYSGNPRYYSLFFALENGMGASDYLRIIWPDQIFNTNKN